MSRPQVGDLIALDWRDSFVHHGQQKIRDVDEDARWISLGYVVRVTDLFLTISSGVCIVGETEGDVDNPLSIPWTQVVKWEVIA